ncbi:MAG: prepilin-type N-terminal cleavage/methylation domain-containing protein [Kiritimatiellia bacterium]|jgi:prepilin-type N-terminal cleavage/methylation domain-containing protein
MKRKPHNKYVRSGFTLVELMVVAVIVAILAAVAIPLMGKSTKRMIATEAESTLGHIRTALRSAYVQTDAYNKNLDGGIIGAGPVVGIVPGLSIGDLDGTYFDDAAYALTLVGPNTYTITATGDNSTAGRASEAAGVLITLDETGTFTRSGL